MSNQLLSTAPYKGTRDFYPDEMRFREWMFSVMKDVSHRYGYEPYDGPMLESFEIYAAKTGEEIVNQQLYWLMDKGDRKLAVRPEMTPTLARLVAKKFNELSKPIRLYSIPNLWRYERPQRGRLREHWQLNVDVLGGDPIEADAEVLDLALDIVRSYGGEKFVNIHINNRKLMDFFFQKKLSLSPAVALQATKAIDGRAKIGEQAFEEWLEKLGFKKSQKEELKEFFKLNFDELCSKYQCDGTDELKRVFDAIDPSNRALIKFDASIMRGMDYYTGTVFEMYDVSPENNRAMFGGGRYDNLIGLFGKQQLSGVGFGWGDVTLQNFLETHDLVPKFDSFIDALVCWTSDQFLAPAKDLARSLRSSGLVISSPLAVGKLGAQLKLADKLNARFALLFGEDEWSRGNVLLKDLKSGTQYELEKNEVLTKILEIKDGTN